MLIFKEVVAITVAKLKKKPKAKQHFRFKNTGTQSVDDVGRQLEKIFNNTNQGSIKSRYTYFDHCTRFIKTVVPHFKIQKLNNIQDKHLEWYGQYLLVQGQSPKTIKNILSSVRFMHKVNPSSRYELADSKEVNNRIGIPSTPDGRADRAWTRRELNAMEDLAYTLNRPEIAKILRFSAMTGCRLDEAASIRRTHLEEAMRTGHLYLTNTKGGRPRSVPLNAEGRKYCRYLMQGTARGEYVFVPVKQKVHQFEKSCQDFVYRHRAKIQDPDRAKTAHNLKPGEKGALSIHGIRHLYARENCEERIKEGYSQIAADREVAELLGHGRASVTRIYTGNAEVKSKK